jgi:hypothetical protein
MMQSAIRLKQKVRSEKLVISHHDLKDLIGKDVEIIILANDENEEAFPPRALQNSAHVAGSFILDEEAMRQLLESRFR